MFRRGELAFFVYGFAKSDRENLRPNEVLAFRALADEYLALDEAGLNAVKSVGEIIELKLISKRYKSEPLAAVHEAAMDLKEAGLMSKQTMRVFDEMSLTPVQEMSAANIRALRARENASQVVFARYLNVTPGLVSQWERGEKRPRGASLKLLSLVKKNGLSAIA